MVVYIKLFKMKDEVFKNYYVKFRGKFIGKIMKFEFQDFYLYGFILGFQEGFQ